MASLYQSSLDASSTLKSWPCHFKFSLTVTTLYSRFSSWTILGKQHSQRESSFLESTRQCGGTSVWLQTLGVRLHESQSPSLYIPDGWCDLQPLALDEISTVILMSWLEETCYILITSFPATLKYPTALIQNRCGVYNDAVLGLGLFIILTVPL
jgi:hypothetical protein